MNATVAPGVLPAFLNLGSGKDFRADHFNLDVDASWSPDAVCDLSRVTGLAEGIGLQTRRFGNVVLRPSLFDQISAIDVLEHVPDLMSLMTNCLALLRTGGIFDISVPYDLSYGAWQDPTHVRAFNERSWLYYTEWFWYMGWSEFRFEVESFNFVPSPAGEALRAKNADREEILRTPRAIDSMSVRLRKIALSDDDRLVYDFHRQKKRAHGESMGPATPALESMASGETWASGETPAFNKTPAFDETWASARERYCLWIVTPEGYGHQKAYDDFALSLSEAFAELGGSAPVIRDLAQTAGRDLIVLGPQLLPPGAADLLPKRSVLFNLEQADRKSPWMSETYLQLIRQFPLADYSSRNIAGLEALGVRHARLLPPGFSPGLVRVPHAAVKDIDVLFYGSINDRRSAIFNELQRRGVKVHALFDTFGTERDIAIGRAKIVINLHFYEAAIFESVRVSYLLANQVCVVSEGDARDPDLAPFAGGLAVEPYEGLVSRCLDLLQNESARNALSREGHRLIKARLQSALLSSLFR